MLLLAGDGVPQREGSRLLALGLACIARLGRQPVEEDERGRAGRRARGNRGARSSRTGQKPRVGMNWAQTPRAPVPVH